MKTQLILKLYLKYYMLFIIVFIGITISSCSNFLKKEQQLTPIYLYYNPLDIDDNVYLKFPLFNNYPNERYKYGVRGPVYEVVYSHTNQYTGIESITKKYSFLGWGDILMFFNDRIFSYTYNDELYITDITELERNATPRRKVAELEYKGGKLTEYHVSNYDNLHYRYEYHPNGMTKTITGSDYWDKSKELFEFNDKGQLIKMVVNDSSNPFMEGLHYHNKFPSISYFKYTNDLCSEKIEKIIFKDYNNNIDTLICKSSFVYNKNGDVTSWIYDGECVADGGNTYDFMHTRTAINFEYVYDKYGNWTTMKVILPDDFARYHYLFKYYQINTGHTYISTQKTPDIKPGEKAIVVFDRQLGYYDSDIEKPKVESSKEVEKPLHKFTAIHGNGLYGKVKTVTGDSYEIDFDENGNTIAEGREYRLKENFEYQDNETYTRDGVGPFKIICENNIRKEVCEEMGLTTEYEFDKYGRVIRHKYSVGMSINEEHFTYDGKNKFPESMIIRGGDEIGEYKNTYHYKYLEKDKNGNWTKRNVICINEYTEYGINGKNNTTTRKFPEEVESRKIVYYK
ncbi:hypothetical protein [uncultured Bacteroides sp.]|uniref:hypothetical protein n=1 Tax=uncultured Bacteroides sp. TaxID=162156 RepID=UPI002598F4FA|nr:hypothetical protein [uncultured Bacteroides sp.]MDN0072871.1 hypothetical protein [Bacteroides caecigallinarum]